MKNSFVNFNNRSKIISMIAVKTIKDTIVSMKKSIKQGCEGFCLTTESLKKEERTKENFLKLYKAAKGLPIYATCYQMNNISNPPETDEELIETLKIYAKNGAKLIDVPQDFYDMQPDQVSWDKTAIEKQKSLIKEFKDMGVEVIMSCHVFHFIPKNEILKIAKSQVERGADIVKIVAYADNEVELDEMYETLFELKKQIKIPVLFLLNGNMGKKFRSISTILGNQPFMLCLENSLNPTPQPSIQGAINILKNAKIYDKEL